VAQEGKSAAQAGGDARIGREPEKQLIGQRLRKLQELRTLGVDPYPHRYEPTHASTEVKEQFEALEQAETEVSIAGRVMAIRGHGKASFSDLQDAVGRIQIYVRLDIAGEAAFDIWKLLDIGDTIGVTGPVFRTRSGEMSVQVKELTLLSKSIRPLPVPKEEMKDGERVVHDAFSSKELRYRRRYLDLTLNPEVRETIRTRTAIMRAIRRFFDDGGFLEVETPILQPLYGGASARPFVTHHNALDIPLYLRISDELYLKRLIMGGFEKVYEVCKDFRNEGMDRTHNPEFTMVEVYQAYADYGDMMTLTENLFAAVARETLGTTQVVYQGQEIELAEPWQRFTMLEAIQEYGGVDVSSVSDDDLRSALSRFGVNGEEIAGLSRGEMVDALFSACAEPKLIQPTLITDHPVETSPLAKRHRENPQLTERFELFVAGSEFANAFSELNDPQDQRGRFEAQMEKRAQGDDEAQVMDEEYLRAMEYGMPPTGGMGFGVDRLVMLLTDQASIRDVILFPQLRPEEGRPAEVGDHDDADDDGA